MLHGIHFILSCFKKSTAFNRVPLFHAAWNPLNSITLHGIHCIQSGCVFPSYMECTAFNHAAWNPRHSIMLHKIHCIQSCCIKSIAFNKVPFLHAAWNPLHSITLHGIHCIHSGCFWPCCIKSTAFNRDALGLTASTAEYKRDPLCHNAWSLLHSMTLHGFHCIQSGCLGPCCKISTAFIHAAGIQCIQ